MQRFYKFLLLAAVLMVPWAARAQVYTFSTDTSSSAWITLSSSATEILSEYDDDDASSVINIGFPFQVGTTNYTQFSANSNDVVGFGSTAVSTYWGNPFTSSYLSYSSVHFPYVSAHGMDNVIGGNGYVKYELTGTAPNRIMVIEYKTNTTYDDSEDAVLLYQIQLYEDSSRLRFVYGSQPSSAYYDSYQIGIALSANEIYWVDPTADTMTYATSAVSTSFSSHPGSYRYYDFVPPVITCPQPVSLAASYLTSDSITVNWLEVGTATNWEVDLYQGSTLVTTDYVTDTFYTFDNLSANTAYTVMVRAICGSDDSSFFTTLDTRTACGVTSLPYTENFDSYTGTTSSGASYHVLPACWDYLNAGTSSYLGYPLIYASSTYAYSGTNSVRFYMYYSSSYGNQTAILPVMDSDTLAVAQITFMARTSSASYANYTNIQVGLINTAGDDSSFVALQTVNGLSTTYQEFSVALDSAANYPWLTRIALRGVKPTSSYCVAYVDDILVERQPTCFRPTTVSTTYIFNDTIAISWTEDSRSSGADYVVEYGLTGFTFGEGTQITVSGDTTAIIDGLTADSYYDIYVYAECSDGSSSSPRMITVHSACGAIADTSLPYTYGFEDASGSGSTGSINSCWNKGTNYTSTAYPYPSGSYNHSGSYSLYFYGYNTYYSYAVMPAFETSLDSLQLSFYNRCSYSSSYYEGTVKVGVMTDPDDISTFTPIATCSSDGTNWTYHEVLLANYTGTGRYIAFKAETVNATYCYTYLDDITVDFAPTCGHVEDLAADYVTAGNAMISWNASALGTYAGAVVEYKDVDDSVWTSTSVSDNATTSITLTSLTPGVTYDLRVATICDDGDTSAFEAIQFATTPLSCVTFDETSTFDDTLTIGTNSNYTIPVNNYYNYTFSEQLVDSSEIDTGSIRAISFQYGGSTANSAKTNVTIYMGTTSLTSLTTSSFVPLANLTPVYQGPLVCTNGWNEFEFNLGTYNYDGSGNLVVAVFDNSGSYNSSTYTFKTHSASGKTVAYYSDGGPFSGSVNTSYSYRNNMIFHFGSCTQLQSCVAPDVWITDRKADTVALAWLPGYDETSWNVAYKESTDTVYSTPVLTTDAAYVFDNLTPATTYDFLVQNVCSGSDSAETVVTVTTPCLADTLPFSEGFADWTTGSSAPTPNCWARYTTASTSYTYPYVSTSYSSDGDGRAMYMYNYSGGANRTWFALPMLADSIHNLILTFDMRSSYSTASYAVRVGVMTDPEDYTTFTEVGSYIPSATNTWEEMEVDFINYDGPEGQIAILATGSYCYAYIDNLYVERAPTCRRPANLAYTVSGDSITVSWNGPTNYESWDVEYGFSGFVPGTGTSASTSDSSIIITGLCSGFDYDVYVNAWCSSDDSSRARMITVSPACDLIARTCMPYTQGFENATAGTAGTMPACWSKGSSYSTSYPYVMNSPTYAHSGSQVLYFYSSSSTYTYAALPEFEIGIDSLAVDFWVRRTSTTSTYGEVIVGVMTNNSDYSTFVPVDTVQATSTTTAEEFEVMFDGYTDTTNSAHHYIAFATNNGGYDNAYLDDIEVYMLTDCRRPSSAYTTNVVYNQLDVVFTPDTVCTATDYEIRWSTSNSVNASVDSLITSSTTNTITGLDAETTYYFWIRALCSDDETSRWLALPAVSTTAACGTVEDVDIQYNAANGDIIVSWTASTIGNPVRYYVSYQEGANGEWNTDTTSDVFYVVNNASSLTTYNFKITTECDSANSAQLPISYTTGSCNIIGAGGTTTSYIPTQYYYGYAYTQSIYTANELMTLGDTIAGLSFYSLGNPGTTRTVELYLANTDVTAFTSTSSYIPADSLSLVYTGTMTITTGWNTLTFDSVFVRDNSRNLVVAFDDNTGSWTSNSGWDATTVDAVRSIYFYQDGSNISPASPSASSSGTLSLVPKVQFNATCVTPTCVAPLVVCTGQTTNSISLAWFQGLNETTWNIDYRKVGDTTWTVAAMADTNTTMTLTGLYASTAYEVRVTSLCSSTETANTVITCYTECGMAPIPFTENFDSWSNSAFEPRCWYYGGTTAPYVANIINYGPMVRLYNNSYIILPELDAAVNTLQARFTYVAGDTTAWMLIGVVSDPEAIGSMTVIDTLYSTGIGDRTYTIRFDTYNDTLGNIAFYTPHGINYTFIDNLVVETIRPCAEAENVTVSNVDTSSATVTWTPYGTNATSYILEYGASGFTLGTGTQVAVSGTSYTLSALTPATTYQVYVYAICSATGDTSYASMYAMFQTECAPVTTFPYLMDFDYAGLPATTYVYDMPACWVNEMTATGTYASGTYRPAIYYTSSSNYVTSGTHCLRLAGNTVLAMPEMGVPLDTLKLTFHEYCGSPNYYGLIIGVVDSVTPGFSASFTPIDTLEYTSGVYSYNRELYLPYSGTARRLAFMNYYTTSTTIQYSYHYIDDVQLDFVPPCVEPQNITTASTENSITLNWNDITAASQWEIEYGTHSFTQGSGTSQLFAAHPATITGLTYSTQYDFYVRAFCSNGDTSDWVSVSTRTTGIMHNLPIELTFEDSTLYNTIDLLNGTLTNVWTIGSAENYDTANAAGHSLYISNDGGTTAAYTNNSSTLVFATVDVNLDSGWTYYNFDWKCYGESSFDFIRVALIPGGEELVPSTSYSTVATTSLPSGWTALDGGSKLNLSSSWNHVNDSIHISTPGGYHFAFIWRNDGSVGTNPGAVIDNINIWDNSSLCRVPVVATETHDYTQSTITWAGTATDFEIAIKATSAAVWPAETFVSAYTYTFTGLMPSTEYQVRLRSVCDTAAGLMSEWALYTFTTDELPCFAPTALTCSATELTTATLSWTAGTTETEWNVHVWNSGFDSIYAASANPFTVTGLSQTTTYNVAVSALCGGGLLESEYSDTIEFTTATCETPGNPTASNVTTNSAVITWTGSADTYLIEYGMGAFGEGQGTTVEVSGTTYTITGLEPETQYSALVRAKCDDVNLSGWTDRAVFTTDVESIDAVSGLNVNIYPNPTSASTTITLSGVNGEVSIAIVDMNGRTVRSETMNCEGDCAHQLEVTGLASGAYFVRISAEGVNSVKKLVVK